MLKPSWLFFLYQSYYTSNFYESCKIVILMISTSSQVFTNQLENSTKQPLFLPGYEGTENMFYFLNKKI